jgi:hypothetical protein
MLNLFSIASARSRLKLEDLAITTAELEEGSYPFRFFDALKDRLVAWFADTTNGIQDFFAERLRTKKNCAWTTFASPATSLQKCSEVRKAQQPTALQQQMPEGPAASTLSVGVVVVAVSEEPPAPQNSGAPTRRAVHLHLWKQAQTPPQLPRPRTQRHRPTPLTSRGQ